MGSVDHHLHMFFFPFPSQGHIIPTIDMARLFAARGVKATIITTPLNAPLILRTLEKTKAPHHSIGIRTIKFPCAEFGIPEGCENADSIQNLNMLHSFFKATMMLQEPLEQLLLEEQPHCLIADMFFPWATDSAAKFSIPRLVFHGTGLFSLCASFCVTTYEPYKNVSSDSEAFLIPNLPGEIKMTRMQLTELSRKDDEEKTLTRLLNDSRESEVKSYGMVVNSFNELEQVYSDHYRKVFGRRTWNIGPVSLCNRDNEEKAKRGKEADIDEHVCLNWLGSKKPNSVVYVCFGSMANFSDSQLGEIAMGLENSGQQFIWVVRKNRKDEEEKEKWVPEGFEKRMEGKGLIIRGWAPQVLILDHEAVGGFVTHCGWNSVLEGVSGGVPMVTWPLCAEQFYNEKFVTEVIKIGVPVGVKVGGGVKKDAIEDALNRIMVGEEAEVLRNNARSLAQKARQAVEVGGSSYSDLNSLIQELQLC
ncbi:scopoletin glucosyltransferase-like [Gastrolobium bilobum]|uniref:scopoletin glucosyltransferase-like n=1 Tax=Gastrolobium bilobum TaxID=150636 RepID=UPI002AB272EB|nr:scopoletin glucosyltransferase-like [Gastrolobium bilobum]